MKTLIYSDVHGNLPAFEKMLIEEGPCDKYICLGDLVNYGPWSNECVELALSLPNTEIIMGNHEESFVDGYYNGRNSLVKIFFSHTYSKFHKIEEIKNFVPYINLGKFICTHTLDNKYIFPDTKVKLEANYIIGHSHIQFKYKNNSFVLYNCGSVGQNRKYINEINYLVYSSKTEIIKMKSLVYDINPLIKKMKKEYYPKECIDYYLNKEKKQLTSL